MFIVSTPVLFLEVFAKIVRAKYQTFVQHNWWAFCFWANLPNSFTQVFSLICLPLVQLDNGIQFPLLFAQNEQSPKMKCSGNPSVLSVGPSWIHLNVMFFLSERRITHEPLSLNYQVLLYNGIPPLVFWECGTYIPMLQVLLMHIDTTISASLSEEGSSMKQWARFSYKDLKKYNLLHYLKLSFASCLENCTCSYFKLL